MDMKSTPDKESPSLTDEEKAFQKIIRYLTYCDRTTHELRCKLTDAGFSEEVIQSSLDRVCRAGLVNDVQLSQRFIEQAFQSGKGKNAAIAGLKKKGISEDVINQLLLESSYEEEDESARALAYLYRHAPRGKNLHDSAFRKLIAKGYSISAASSAASTYCSEQAAESNREF